MTHTNKFMDNMDFLIGLYFMLGAKGLSPLAKASHAITEVNLFAFAYRLFHADFSSNSS